MPLATSATPIRSHLPPPPPSSPNILLATKAREIILGTRPTVILRFSECHWQLVPHPLGPPPPSSPNILLAIKAREIILGTRTTVILRFSECHWQLVPHPLGPPSPPPPPPPPPSSPNILLVTKAREIILGTRPTVILRFSECHWQLVPHPLGPPPPPLISQYFVGDKSTGDNPGNKDYSNTKVQ